ncbi:MAG: HupE/UreJ family protein [Opitutaceae bacterium]|nr:HupE/UreJ family protein [Opitutaceae bacterium]
MNAARRLVFRLALGFVALAATGRAHDPGISTAQGELLSDALLLVTGFAPADVEQLLPPELRRDTAWTQAEFDAVRDRLLALAPQLWEVRAGEARLTPSETRAELLPGDNVSFRAVYALGAEHAPLTLRALKIGDLPSGHRQFVIVADVRGSVLVKKLLKAEDAAVALPLATVEHVAGLTAASPPASPPPPGAGPSEAATWWEFIKLGAHHIWTGYDHLLFLVALLVVCRSFRACVVIITSFTLAHSITLALAALDVVSLPPRLVEPVIAASIVLVGVENLLRRGAEPRGRWVLTFALGLMHGFGFAGVLRDLGLGRDGGSVVMPLLTFNLGVELGQIAVAAILLPGLLWLRCNEKFVTRGVPAISVLVVLAGMFWLIQRTVLG